MVDTRIETYVPLYRKYRPQVFADVSGQDAIVQTLGNAIRLNKVAHAYLFCGPRGTGKTSTARIFAKSLNCEQGPTVTPCLQCASCQGIAQGNALDVIEFDAASNNGVSDARELIENCQYTSMTGRFKVYIIDEVHMLTPQAFNALLKTLEEPPPNVIFIFATTEAHKVLPTIISRCQRFDFNRITTENIIARLQLIAERESIAIDEEALLMIARHARGGLRDAVGLLDQVAVLGRAQPDKIIGRKDVALFIGTLEEDLLLKLSESIARRQAAELLHELTELVNRGIEPIQLLKDLTVHFRNLLLVQATGAEADPELLSLPAEYHGRLAEQVALFPEPEEIPQIIARLSFVERNVRNSNQPQLWLEVGLIELAYRYEIQLVKDLSDRIARLEAQLAGGVPAPAAMSAPKAPPTAPVSKPSASTAPAAPASEPSAPAPAAPAKPHSSVPNSSMPSSSLPQQKPAAIAQPAASDGAMPADFERICASVASMTTRALLQQHAFPISLEGDLLVLGCASEPTLNLLKKPDKLIHLQKAVDKFYNRPMRIDLRLEKKSEQTPAAPPPLANVAPASQPEPVSAQAPSLAPGPAEGQSAEAQDEDEDASRPPLEMSASDWDDPESAMAMAQSMAAAAKASLAQRDETNQPAAEPEPSEPPAPAGAAVTSASVSSPVGSGGNGSSDPALAEAKKHAVELLQGRILD